MVIFKKLRWKNFLSGGNTYNEVNIEPNGGKITLITSEVNGVGKSLILDAFCFALFNKSFRGVSKRALLVNSINKKDCVVEVHFSIGSDEYKVIRGIAPNVFEIHKNGVLMNQLSKELDYQRILEENILNMNYKSFTQIVILGSSNHTPFLELTSANRREVVDVMLDLNVIGLMNDQLKSKYKVLLDNLNEQEHAMEILKNKYLSANNVIKKLIKTKEESSNKLKEEIASIENNIKQLQEDKDNTNTEKDKLLIEELNKTHKELLDQQRKVDNSILLLKRDNNTIKKELEFYTENVICPTCDQNLDPQFVSDRKQKLVDDARDNINTIKEKEKDVESIKDKIKGVDELKKEYQTLQQKIVEIQRRIDYNKEQIARLNRMNDTTSIDRDIEKEKELLKQIQKEGVDLKNSVDTLKDEIDVHEFAMVLMKDTGFKSMVIKEYLPVINQLINMYLKKLGSYFYFEFDENFDDTVLARHVDELQYASLSGGERIRLTLAILFTWRYICIKKNTANCNLLILDEIFSESLDRDGVDATIALLKELNGIHTFIISPNSENIRPKFSDIIEVTKPADFSVYTSITQ